MSKKTEIEFDSALTQKELNAICKSGELGLEIAQEWKRLIQPFTPHQDGNLDSPKVTPWEIEYTVPYDYYQYYGEDFNWRKDTNPYATGRWDEAAEKAGQDEKLISAVSKWLAR